MSPRYLLFFVFLLLIAKPLMADGTGSGNGGDIVKLDIVSVRNLIYANCDNWQTLKRAKVDCTALRAKMDEVGTVFGPPGHLAIENEVTLEDGIPRSGKNDPVIPKVTFSRNFWLASSADTPAKIGIETHEFFGLLSIERTDDYHFSNALVNELRSTWLFTCVATCLHHDRGSSSVIASATSEQEALVNMQKACVAVGGTNSVLATSVSYSSTTWNGVNISSIVFDKNAACSSK